jgi:hypothetical protein
VVPAKGRLVDFGEGETTSLIGIIDVSKVIVEVVEATRMSANIARKWRVKRDAHALLPPAVLFAAAMAKLCPDAGWRDKSLHERA